MQFIREGDFAGVRYNVGAHTDDFEIYDVVADPEQRTNLAANQTKLQQQMKDRVLQLRRPDSEAKRPYDAEMMPAVRVEKTEPGVFWSRYAGRFPWVPELTGMKPEASGKSARIEIGTSREPGRAWLAGF